MDCEGNCGAEVDAADDTWWQVLAPGCDGREFDFCSLACMSSWLDAERASTS